MQSDHDLLISLAVKVENLTLEVRSLRDTVGDRIKMLELNKVDKSVYQDLIKDLKEKDEDYEQRLRRLERVMYIGFGALALIQLLLK